MDATPKGMETHGAELYLRGASNCDHKTIFSKPHDKNLAATKSNFQWRSYHSSDFDSSQPITFQNSWSAHNGKISSKKSLNLNSRR